ncbi:MAG: tetratricopeptide repeat protein, partial [Candidatus Aenigmatarchaeota archaeon]
MKIISILILSFFLLFSNISSYSQQNDWQSTVDIALFFFKDGNFSEALHFSLKSLEIAKKDFGEVSEPYFISLLFISQVYSRLQDLENSIKYASLAINIARKLYPTSEYPEGHPFLATSINNLGFLYLEKGEYSKAEGLLEEGLQMLRNIYSKERYPEGHPDLATSINNLGLLYQEKGEYSKAEGLLEEGLQMLRNIYSKERYPEGHP